MSRARRLGVLLDLYGPGFGDDRDEAIACLSPEDQDALAACDEDDRALLNACLGAEADLAARQYAAAERLAALAPSGSRDDGGWVAALPDHDRPAALSALNELCWAAYPAPEVERVW